jgi:hypothetical protein
LNKLCHHSPPYIEHQQHAISPVVQQDNYLVSQPFGGDFTVQYCGVRNWLDEINESQFQIYNYLI